MFMKKRALWRGLTTLFTFIFSLTIIIGVVAESYKATIDTALGTLSEKFVSENTEDDPLYDKFQPSAEVLNEDGTGNSHALIQKAIDLNRQQAAEGAVLLKNNNAGRQFPGDVIRNPFSRIAAGFQLRRQGTGSLYQSGAGAYSE